MWPGNAFLRRLRELLWEYINKYGRKSIYVKIPNWAKKDINWWIQALTTFEEASIIQICELKREDIVLAFDGATNGSREKGWCPGIGAVLNGQLIMERVPAQYLSYYENKDKEYTKEYAIAHFEMLAIIVGLWHFRNCFKCNHWILLRTDNKTVEAVLKNKNTADMFLADAVRWVCMFAKERNIRFYIKYVWTKENKIPDALSRYDLSKTIELTKKVTNQQPRICRNVIFPDINIW